MNSKFFRKKAILLTLSLLLAFSVFYTHTAVTEAATTSATQDDGDNLDRWMDVCGDMLSNLKKKHFKYSNSNTKRTFSEAVKKSKRANCSLYVSWCLQQYGAIKKGQTFYVLGSGAIKKNFSHWGSKVKVIRVYKRCSRAKLEPGDVVCWKGSAHSNIYAGRNSDGERVWYDGGKVATKGNHNGSRYSHTGKRSLGYLNNRTISYIIRIKNV